MLNLKKLKKNKTLVIEPHPDRVLIKITKGAWDSLFYKEVVRNDGSKTKLFTSIEESEGYDKRYTQNVSVGYVIATGKNVKKIIPNDIAIIDYLTSNDNDNLVGFINGDRIMSIVAETTYHVKDAIPDLNGRKAFVKGDYDTISQILGVVRNNKIVAFTPYVFLAHKSNLILKVLANGRIDETKETISERELLSADISIPFKDGNKIILKEEDMFSRDIGGKEVSVMFERDILCKKK